MDSSAEAADRRAPVSGIVYGMPNGDYHAMDALGSSTLKRMAQSPFHAFKLGIDPARPVIPPTAAMAAGTLAHCAILEPDKLEERYTVRPAGIDGRTREGKAWILDNTHFGCEFVTEEQMQTAMRQAAAVRQLPEVVSLLDGEGASEVSAFWTRDVIHADTGELEQIQCKCRPDRVCETEDGQAVVLLDVKTAKQADADGFARAIWNFRYDLQAAHYCDGFEKASGLMVLGMVFVVIESDYPHAAAAYILDDDAMTKARAEVSDLVGLYARCQRTNTWPGYPNTVQPISLPAWAHR